MHAAASPGVPITGGHPLSDGLSAGVPRGAAAARPAPSAPAAGRRAAASAPPPTPSQPAATGDATPLCEDVSANHRTSNLPYRTPLPSQGRREGGHGGPPCSVRLVAAAVLEEDESALGAAARPAPGRRRRSRASGELPRRRDRPRAGRARTVALLPRLPRGAERRGGRPLPARPRWRRPAVARAAGDQARARRAPSAASGAALTSGISTLLLRSAHGSGD